MNTLFTTLISTLCLITSFAIVLTNNIYAEDEGHESDHHLEHTHGTHKECPLPNSAKDIINCALEMHPQVIRGIQEIDSLKNLEEQAGQRPNPIFSSRYVKGTNNTSELETNLSFIVELGDKRNSRRQYAIAQKDKAIKFKELTQAEVKIQTIKNLFRLRQIVKEQRILSETLRAFSKVTNQLRQKPVLSPEQESSLTVFEIALEEIKIKKSEIFEEERKIEHYFHVTTGHSLEEIIDYLPSIPKKWKNISLKNKIDLSPKLNQLSSFAELARKNFDIEKSQSWPNLRIGPSFSIDKETYNDNKMIGFNIQLPIPILQTNNGAKAYARSELIRAQKNISITRAQEAHERVEQFKIYKSTAHILNKTMKFSEIDKKYKRIEKLYLRGVISSSVFLDSLKQKLSYLETRHNREMTALSALWNIYKYNGSIFKEQL